MRALAHLALGVALSAVGVTAVAQQAGPSAPTVAPKPIRHTVVVDAGHGGLQPGMTARLPGGVTMPEKNITLGIALKLADALRKRGVEVVMTRTIDKFVALEERGHIANAAKGDLFVSIHVNAPGDGQAHYAAERGFETYFLDEARTEDERRVAAMENADVRFETSVTAKRNDPLSFIMADMLQNEHLRESRDFATTIQEFLTPTHPGPNRGVKQAGFAVLRYAYMPAVLVETGFGTNVSEANWLASESGQRALANNIANATMEYLKNYERRVNSGQQR